MTTPIVATQFAAIDAALRPLTEAVRRFLAQHTEKLSGLTRREAGKHLG
jgi:hypothetical protein